MRFTRVGSASTAMTRETTAAIVAGFSRMGEGPNRGFMKQLDRKEVRRLVANLLYASGCGCCGDRDATEAAKESLGKLLRVPKYSDGSGRDFYRYRTK